MRFLLAVVLALVVVTTPDPFDGRVKYAHGVMYSWWIQRDDGQRMMHYNVIWCPPDDEMMGEYECELYMDGVRMRADTRLDDGDGEVELRL